MVQKVTATANLGRVPCGTSDEYRYEWRAEVGSAGAWLEGAPQAPGHPLCSHLRFAGRTLTSGSLVLLTLHARPAGPAQLTVNSEKMVIGTMLVKDVIQALTQ